MYFGRSLFQSVVERLQSESADAEADAIEPAAHVPRVTTSFIFDTSNDDPSEGTDGIDRVASEYHNFEFTEIDQRSELPDAEEIAPPVEAEPEIPAKEYSYLNQTDPASVNSELKINSLTTIDALQLARRKFARDNHPDMVPEAHRHEATLRMTAANLLIDQAIKALELRSRLGA